MIKYGAEGSWDFLKAVYDELDKSSDDENYSLEIKMVLHGTKDVTVSLEIMPMFDLVIMVGAWAEANGTFASVPSTLKVVDAN